MAGESGTLGEKVAALSALRTHRPQQGHCSALKKITAKALPPKQSTLNKFYYLAIPRNRLKVLPHFKSKAGIQETTVKEMKHNVNV